MEKKATSWEPVEKWYQSIVENEGHYFHKRIIIPGIMQLAGSISSILDLACGTGILAHHLPSHALYFGVDISPSFIKSAQNKKTSVSHHFILGDVTKPLNLKQIEFTHSTLILAAQNMQHPYLAFQNAAKYLIKNGIFIIVVNHPCFRIPRQSSWGVDSSKKIQYRRIDRYASTLEIPIHAHPSKGERSTVTWSFHYSLSQLSKWLFEAGFAIEIMEEWCSDKISTGKNAKMENISRTEIPLFLAIKAKKM